MKRIRQTVSRERVARDRPNAFPQDRARVLGADRARGEPLPARVRTLMEPRFGHDFANVRIHADVGADSIARALDARAVTVHENVYFRDGAFDPSDLGSVHLLAHELAHVAQHAEAGGADSGLSERSDASEHNARAAADAAFAGGPVSVGGAAPAAVAREEGGPGKEYESPLGRWGEILEAPNAMAGFEIPGLDFISKPLAAVGGLDKAMHATNGLGAASGLMTDAGGVLGLTAKIGEDDLGKAAAGKLGGVGGLLGAGSSALDAVGDFSAGKTGKGALDSTKSVSGLLSGLGSIGGFSLAESGGMSATAALSGEGLGALASLGPWGAVLGAGLAGAGIGTELSEHTSVGERTQESLGGIDSVMTAITGDGKTPWSLRTSDAMSEGFSKGNLSSFSGVGNYAKGVGNALELGGFGLAGALGGIGGGVSDAENWVGGKYDAAKGAVGGGIANAAGWLWDKL